MLNGLFRQTEQSFALLLLAAALFFLPLGEVKLTASIAWSDALFLLALMVAVIELFVVRVVAIERAAIDLFIVYGVVVLLLGLVYLAHSLGNNYELVWDGSQKYRADLNSVVGYVRMLGLSTNSIEARKFVLVLIALAIVPVSFALFRVATYRYYILLLQCLALGAVVGAVYVWVDYLGVIEGRFQGRWIGFGGRPAGLTAHPNALASNCLLALPGILTSFTLSRKLVAKGLWLFALWLIWSVLGFSASRSGAAQFLFIVGVFFVWSDNVPWLVVRAFLLFLVLFVVLSSETSLGSAGVERLYTDGEGVSSLTRRVLANVASGQAWESPFIGVGYQAVGFAHNLYLQMFHVGGVMGFIAYLVATFAPLVMLLRFRRGALHRAEHIVYKVMVVCIVNRALFSFVESNTSDFAKSIFYGLCIMLAVFFSVRHTVVEPPDKTIFL